MESNRAEPRDAPERSDRTIRPWLPYLIYSKVTGVVTLLLVVCCLVGMVAGGPLEIPGFVALALAITVGVIWAVFLWLAGSHIRKAAALLSGKAWVRWRYEPETWHLYLDERKSRGRLFALVFIGVMAGVGLLTGFLLSEEGMQIGGSSSKTVLVPTAVGLAGGGVVSLFVVLTGAGVTRRLRSMPGVFVLSPTGLHLTGVFWPFRGFGASLSEVERKGNRLIFEFEGSYRNNRTCQKLEVPVPPGKEGVADRIVAKLSEKF